MYVLSTVACINTNNNVTKPTELEKFAILLFFIIIVFLEYLLFV